jgi:hypothetical protein
VRSFIGIVGIGASLAAAQPAAVRTFETERPGAPPDGFTLTATRQERPGSWSIRREGSSQFLVHDADTPPQAGFAIAAATNAGTFRDVVVSARVKLVGGERAGGLVWRYQDAQNYYAVSLDLLRHELAMYRVVAGNRIRVEREDDLDLDVDAWHALRIVHEESSARVYLGGIRVFDVRDRTFRAGAAGLWSTSGSTAAFDDVRIAAVDDRRDR